MADSRIVAEILGGAGNCGFYVGADLEGANLAGADFAHCRLWGTNLKGANLSGANLTDARCNGANLEGANLRGANLRDADFAPLGDQGGANLSNADLTGANLEGTNLDGANTRGAKGLGSESAEPVHTKARVEVAPELQPPSSVQGAEYTLRYYLGRFANGVLIDQKNRKRLLAAARELEIGLSKKQFNILVMAAIKEQGDVKGATIDLPISVSREVAEQLAEKAGGQSKVVAT